ncbi:MAG: hypothetical protein CVU55_05755 [Deltaproteobacteria bacterium HGW-Deltaproteobacteria-13]|jgi:hypothetical protein|nr:MAG: hypothetical protein CVU55_05755 [Deltaproteobacteria bacterium HGW-Deltaproteobacteria-13]
MYLFTVSLYPNDKAKEVAETYLKAMKKFPDDANVATPILPVAVRGTHQGIKAMVIYDVKKGKLDDAMTLAVNRLSMFHGIQGYRYANKVFLTLEEALKIIGM